MHEGESAAAKKCRGPHFSLASQLGSALFSGQEGPS